MQIFFNVGACPSRNVSLIFIIPMGKKITSFLLGALAMMIMAAPAQAQSRQDRKAQIQSDLMKMKSAPGFNKEKTAALADFKAKHPKIFQRRFITQKKNNTVMRVPQSLRPRTPFSVTNNGNGQIILKSANTNLIANVTYYPEIEYASQRSISRINVGAPTEMDSLVNGNYTFYNGATIQDGVYYGVNAVLDYLWLGFWWIDFYSFNTDSWELQGVNEIDDETGDFSLMAGDLATAADGTVYGAFYNADGSATELGIPDYANMTRTTIGTLENDYLVLAISKEGVLYGIAYDGNLYKIDKTNAQETLVGPTGIEVADEEGAYYQSGEIDPSDNTFYWFGVPVADGETNLYTVNLETGAATLVQPLGEYNIVGLIVDKPAAEDGAPAAVEDLTVNFANGATTGTVSFTAPTKTFGGADLTGDLTYTIKAGDQVVATGTTTPGAAVTVEVTLPEGMQTIKVITSNEAGDSPASKQSLWIGFDVPKAPANVAFTADGNNITVTWDAVTEAVHNGYLSDITYNVYRIVGEEKIKVAENISATTFSETLELGSLAVYKYGVEANNGALTSALSISDGTALGNAIEPPYFADFTKEDVFNLFTVIDANEDNSTFTYYSEARYRYHTSNPGDDWLISPPIHLQAGKAYNVIVNASAYSARYPERFEVKVGNAAQPSAMTLTAIGPTDVTCPSEAPEDYEGSVQVTEDGDYYIGIHAISDPDEFYLYVNSLTVELGPEPGAPQAVTNLTVTPDSEGYTAATISFVAPTLSIAGDALTGNIKADIYRDGELIATLEDVAPGSEQSYDDAAEDLTIGTHTYQVYVSNDLGTGLKSEKVSAYIGMDSPSPVPSVTVKDNIGTITIDWEKVTEGVHGGIIIPEKMDYIVWSLVEDGGYLNYGEQLDSLRNANTTTVAFDANVGEQGYSYWAVQPKNEAGQDAGTVGTLITGKPFELPLEEHFAGNQLQIPGWFSDNDGSTYISGWYEYYNVSMYFDAESSDGDGASIAISTEAPDTWGMLTPGKISVAGVANPTLIMDVKSTSRTNKFVVAVEKADGTEEVALEEFAPTSDFQSVKVNLAKYASEPYIFVKMYALFDEVGSFWIDNINFIDFMEYNLAAAKIATPKNITAGSNGKVNFTVKNMGEYEAKNYKVKVSVADEVLIDETVTEPLASLASKSFEATYNTTIFTEAGDKAVKAEVTYDNDLNDDDNVIEDVFTVNAPSAAGVENLTAEAQENGYKVSWSAPSVIAATNTETFEDTEVFPTFSIGGITDTNHYGAFGDWKLYDGDGQQVYGWSSETISFENEYQPNAWMAFDPVKAGFSTDQYTPHSGSQFLMAMCPDTASDDWLISPELPGMAQTISFWASEASTQYGDETFEILVSSTDNEIASFTKIANDAVSSGDWTKFSFDLPEGTKYFAIRHTGNDIFAMFVDDIEFTVGGGSIESYNVYVDEQLYGNTAETNIDVKDLTVGGHKVSVTIIYAGGIESAPVSINVDVTAIENLLSDENPVDIYSLDGVLVRQNATSASGLKKGVYIVNGRQAIVR